MTSKILDMNKNKKKKPGQEKRTAMEILSSMKPQEIKEISDHLTTKFLDSIKKGLEGDFDFADYPIFEAVDRLYESYEPRGCYFCDRSIDGNETPFDFPNKTKLCLSCMLKVANLLVSFGINHEALFPGMADRRKIQEVLYQEIQMLPTPSIN